MKNSKGRLVIRAKDVPFCPVCGNKGVRLYCGQVDRLFSAPGVWGSKKCNNSQCGLVWLNPAPIAEDIHLAYENYYTHADESVIDNSVGKIRPSWQGYRALVFGSDKYPATLKQKIIGACFFLLPNRRPAVEYPIRQLQGMLVGKVLEIGCGAGDMLCSLKDQGWQTVGIDFDAGAVEAARRKGLNILVGDLAKQGFADASFDVVLMNHVIEHLPEPVDTLREIKRILRPGGRLVGITPNADSWGHKQFAKDWQALHPPQHLHIFTQNAFRNVANLAGFEQVLVKNSVMSAISIFRESIQLRSPKLLANTATSRIYLEVIWMWEWVLTVVGINAGELLVFVAEKKK